MLSFTQDNGFGMERGGRDWVNAEKWSGYSILATMMCLGVRCLPPASFGLSNGHLNFGRVLHTRHWATAGRCVSLATACLNERSTATT